MSMSRWRCSKPLSWRFVLWALKILSKSCKASELRILSVYSGICSRFAVTIVLLFLEEEITEQSWFQSPLISSCWCSAQLTLHRSRHGGGDKRGGSGPGLRSSRRSHRSSHLLLSRPETLPHWRCRSAPRPVSQAERRLRSQQAPSERCKAWLWENTTTWRHRCGRLREVPVCQHCWWMDQESLPRRRRRWGLEIRGRETFGACSWQSRRTHCVCDLARLIAGQVLCYLMRLNMMFKQQETCNISRLRCFNWVVETTFLLLKWHCVANAVSTIGN